MQFFLISFCYIFAFTNLKRNLLKTNLLLLQKGVSMAQRARIKLIGNDPQSLQKICNQIQKIAERTGVRIRGPIPIPSKRIVLPVRKSPCGNGTATYDHLEMKLHKRIIDMDAEEKSMRLLMRIHVPEDVHIEIAIERK